MKEKYLFFILILFIGFSSCEDSNTEDNSKLELSETSFQNVSSDGVNLTINITSSDSWVAATSSTWCDLVPNQGTSNQSLNIVVEANLSTTARNTTVVVTSSGIKKTITISQQGSNSTTGEYHYELPVIFHVLYKNSSDPKQYVSQSRLADILNVVNKLYKDKIKSVDMNLTFTLASTDPDGKALTTPGVEYKLWEGSYPIDCDKFMEDDTSKGGVGYVKYLWDPNQYINVMIYNFTTDPQSSTTTLGISHLPFTTTGSNSLEGLNETKYSYLELKNLSFPYCTSINSLFIDQQSTSTRYNTTDVTVTLAHELGHYLGLHHVFSEGPEGSCEDTDYCKDTPSYDKDAYDMNYQWAIASGVAENNLFAYLVERESCDGTKFTSHNIMDYSVSYSDQFTQDQRNRIRHVLTYSPLIPGPKKDQTSTRAVVEGPLDLPILIRK